MYRLACLTQLLPLLLLSSIAIINLGFYICVKFFYNLYTHLRRPTPNDSSGTVQFTLHV